MLWRAGTFKEPRKYITDEVSQCAKIIVYKTNWNSSTCSNPWERPYDDHITVLEKAWKDSSNRQEGMAQLIVFSIIKNSSTAFVGLHTHTYTHTHTHTHIYIYIYIYI